MLFWIGVVLLLIVYFLVDVHYFLRVIVTYVIARFLRKKIGLMDPSTVYGICLPSDADFLLTHMNNARYLREHDFARFDQATRSGILVKAMEKGGAFPASAITIRYRLPLMMFSTYKVVSTPVWWDAKFIYYDQRIITLSDGIVRSITYTKLALIKLDLETLIREIDPNIKKPEAPADLQKWIEFNDLSSEKMKTK